MGNLCLSSFQILNKVEYSCHPNLILPFVLTGSFLYFQQISNAYHKLGTMINSRDLGVSETNKMTVFMALRHQ